MTKRGRPKKNTNADNPLPMTHDSTIQQPQITDVMVDCMTLPQSNYSIASLISALPGRECEIETIHRLIVDCVETGSLPLCSVIPPPPLLYIHGLPGTGKTVVTRGILRCLRARGVVVDVVESGGGPLSGVMQAIVRSLIRLSSKDLSNDTFYQTHSLHIGDRVALFLDWLQQLCQNQAPTFIVVDGAERLGQCSKAALNAFMRMSDITRCPICLILVSRRSWLHFKDSVGSLQPIVIPFSAYTADTLSHILRYYYDDDSLVLRATLGTEAAPSALLTQLYPLFCDRVVQVFVSACRDIRELRHLCRQLWPSYVSPIVNSAISLSHSSSIQDVSAQLFAKAKEHFRNELNRVYIRDSSTTNGGVGFNGAAALRQALSLQGKVMLIASYLISHNLAKWDVKYFTKFPGRLNRLRKNSGIDQTKEDEHNARLFSLDRLLAAYHSLMHSIGHRHDCRVSNQAFIATLTSHQLLTLVSSKSRWLDGDSVRFRCNVSEDVVTAVAESVGIDLLLYLDKAAR